MVTMFFVDVNLDSGDVNNGFRAQVNGGFQISRNEYSHPQNLYSHRPEYAPGQTLSRSSGLLIEFILVIKVASVYG